MYTRNKFYIVSITVKAQKSSDRHTEMKNNAL